MSPRALLLLGAAALVTATVFVLLPSDPGAPGPSAARSDAMEPTASPSSSQNAAAAGAPADATPGHAARGPAVAERRTETESADPDRAAATSSLRLRVVDENGEPLAGARIYLVANTEDDFVFFGRDIDWSALDRDPSTAVATGLTGADGVFATDLVPSASAVAVGVSATERTRRTAAFHSAPAGETVHLDDFALAPAESLVVELVEADGSPSQGATLALWLDAPSHEEDDGVVRNFRSETDAAGIARFDHLPHFIDGSWRLSGAIAGDLDPSARVPPQGDEDHRLRVTLDDAIWVRGRVVDADGAPCPDLPVHVVDGSLALAFGDADLTAEELLGELPGLVQLISADEAEADEVPDDMRTGPDGRFRQRKSKIWDEGPEEVPEVVAAAVQDGSLLVESAWHRTGEEILITLPRRHRMTGRVVAENGVLPPGLRVRFHLRHDLLTGNDGDEDDQPPRPHNDPRISAACDASGGYEVRLLPGPYWIECEHPGGRTRHAGPYRIEADGSLPELTLPTPQVVTLQVRDAEGAPVSGLVAHRAAAPDADALEQDAVGESFASDDPMAMMLSGSDTKEWIEGSRAARIEGSDAVWNEYEGGHWRYTVEAEGAAPAFVDIDLAVETGDVTRLLTLGATGALAVTALDRHGQPARDVVLAIRPKTEVGIQDVSFEEFQRRRELLQQAVPDARGLAHFTAVRPGPYELLAVPEKLSRFDMMELLDEDQAVLETVTVNGGETARVEVSLDNLAELRIVVTDSGSLLPGAEVRVTEVTELPRISFGNTSGAGGVTGADGTLTLGTLVPGRRYLVKARVASEDWRRSHAWTRTEVEILAGSQECTLELANGGLRIEVAGTRETVELIVARIPSAAEDEEGPSSWMAERRAALSVEEWFEEEACAKLPTEAGAPVVIQHLAPGRYRVLARVPEQARAASQEVVVDGSVVDVGTLTLAPLVELEVQLDGMEDWSSEHAFATEIRCIPASGGRAAARNEYFLMTDEPAISWQVAPGAYQLVLTHDGEELARSDEFEVALGQPRRIDWAPGVAPPRDE